MQDKQQKEAELKEALDLYNYWINKHRQLQDAIQNVSSRISDLTNLSNTQQAELDRLKAAAKAKHDAAMMAKDLEALIESLKDQIAQKEKLKVDTEATHKTLRTKQQEDCDAAIQKR